MKYTLNTLLILVFFTFTGCGGGGGGSNAQETSGRDLYTGEAYIDSIPSDTTPVSNLALIPTPPASIPLLVILLEYNNQQIVSNDATWAQKFFSDNPHTLNNYYKEISHNQFSFTPASETYGATNDGIIKIHLNKDHINTPINDSSFSSKLAADINASLNAADPYTDFHSFDTDNNGALTPYELSIIFIIAGYEDAYVGGHITNGIWAHQSALSISYAPTLDGVSVCNGSKGGRFALFGERHGDSSSSHDATIGVIAHELGHEIFSLPDLYNTNGVYGGIGFFGLMGGGSWTRVDKTENYGDTPTHMSAWSKAFIGWVTPQELNNTTATLNESASNTYNVIKIPISANHYYLLENRNNSGYDRGLRSLGRDFEGGMLIWHINQTRLTTDNFRYNNVNADVNNKGVDVVEASEPILDTQPNSAGSQKAFFYYSNRSSFGNKVTEIPDPGATMTFNIH